MLGFKELAFLDIQNVFMNPEEFGEKHFIDGEEMTLKEISEAYNIPITTLYHWRKHKKDRCEFETKVHNYKEEQSIEHEQELQLS